MKGLIMIWLLTAGAGISYSIVKERAEIINRLKGLERGLNCLAYYMCQWQMPVQEAMEQAAKEEQGVLQEFFEQIRHTLAERGGESLGIIWQRESNKYLLVPQRLPEKVKCLWQNCFFQVPMEPEALQRRLTERAKEMSDFTKELQEKYKEEQRLVFTMGIFTGAFLCLILW